MSGEELDEFDLRVLKGLCVECGESKSVTTYLWQGRHEIPVCQPCFDIENETEMVWNEFVIENGRSPTLPEYLSAAGRLEEEE